MLLTSPQIEIVVTGCDLHGDLDSSTYHLLVETWVYLVACAHTGRAEGSHVTVGVVSTGE